MGKMSELAAELAELKRCGEVLIGISETLTEMFPVRKRRLSRYPRQRKKRSLRRRRRQKR